MQSFSFFQRTIPLVSKHNRMSLSMIFMFLVFLLSFVMACTILFSNGFHKWGTSGACNITVEIPFNGVANGQMDQYRAIHTQKVQQVMDMIRQIDGVLAVQSVDPEKLRSMLAKWVGESNLMQDFFLPSLLDIKVDPYKKINLAQLTQQLRTIASDISVENHNAWSQKLLFFGQSLKFMTLIIGGFILLCIMVIVVLITKSSLQAYYSILDILRLMGAKDSYIANIFQSQIMRSAFLGGGLGTVLAIPTVYALMIMMKYLGLDGVTWQTVLWHILSALALIPFGVILIGAIVSRITVLMSLRHLDRA